ncbi:peptidase U32 family protein [Vagococcus jeotgali]|uniref:peptidase U32 family protein n=1 Tax=Vagococcus jeotgali TaxID=3109030 RepID=UPI002DD8E83D|nr:peptidase U32 family protein [Vagococcus sp. B2T-5]
MIEISTSVESLEQAKRLVTLDIDVLYVGEEEFGLRLPYNFTRSELKEVVKLAHKHDKKVRVAVNAIMHPEKMEKIPEYLAYLESINVDDIVVGDPGVIYVLRRDGYNLPFIYDAATMVTSSRQINFWAKKGARGAVLAREIPFLELEEIAKEASVFCEVLVYGATCIHHSKRPLVSNYYSFTKQKDGVGKSKGLFISEPKEEDTHYSIYEDQHGTHIFATNDVDLMLETSDLTSAGLTHWKLNGMYTPGEDYLKILECFIEAKHLIETGKWSTDEVSRLQEVIEAHHPVGRGLDTGFYYLNPDEIR